MTNDLQHHATDPAGTREHGERADGSPAPVVVVVLDAADCDVLLAGADEGTFPHLAALRERGAWGEFECPAGFGSGSAWVSFSTGVTPAKHGRYFYRRVLPGSYEAQYHRGDELQRPSLAEVVSQHGRRVAAVDLPSMPVVDGINGISVADWITHDLVYQELRTSPPELGPELVREFGANPVMKCDRPHHRTLDEHRELHAELMARIEQKRAANRELFGREPWDLFMTAFTEPHCAGHQCWHVRDPEHPLFADLGNDPAEFDPVVDVYRAIDAAIGDLLEIVPVDATVLVASATGMGPNFTGNMVLDEILRRRDRVRATRRVSTWARSKQLAKRVLPNEVKRRFRPMKRRVEERVSVGDRAGRKSFAVPHNDITGAVRLNIVGREQHGVLRPGEEVDRYVDELRHDLLALRNLDTGKPVVREVIRVADQLEGDAIDELPDVFVVWEREAYPDRIGSDQVGEIEHRHRGNRTGDHLDRHVFFAAGPGIEPGRVDGVSVLDFAPTIATLLGASMPDADGAPVARLGADARS